MNADSTSSAGSGQVVVAGTFVLDLITATTSRWMGRQRPHAPVVPTPYGQVVEQLNDPRGPLLRNDGVNILLIRPEDWLRNADSANYAVTPEATAMAAEVAGRLRAASAWSTATWLVAIPPAAPTLLARPDCAAWLSAQTEGLTQAVTGTPGLHLVDLGAVNELYDLEVIHDDYSDKIAHIPFTEEYQAALGTWLARLAASVLAKPRKLIVLDCDNTLWQGTCGEDGPGAIRVTAPYLELQRFMREQRAQGKVLALCSRNDEKDVLAVFSRADMELRVEEVTSRRIGWQAKSEAIAELAAELGFGLDTVIFVDDDPVECELVRHHLPEVAVVELPQRPAEIPAALRHEWAFDQFAVTEDDRLRAGRFAQDQTRKAAERDSLDYADFIRRCQVRVTFDPLTEAQLDRAAQLTTRTTQFNLTGEPFSAAALRSFLNPGHGWTVHVSDRFGDYGTVGLVLIDPPGTMPGTLPVRLLLLSCRVLNRGVERQVTGLLRELAEAAALRTISLRFARTQRNRPAQQYLAALAGCDSGNLESPVLVPI